MTTYPLRHVSFVLMDNHNHLLVETLRANLSTGMQILNCSDWRPDPAVQELEELRSRPSLETIRDVVATQFGIDAADWSKRRRLDKLPRAVATYLGPRFFYPANDAGAGLGSSSGRGVGQEIRRIKAAGSRCGKTAQQSAKCDSNDCCAFAPNVPVVYKPQLSPTVPVWVSRIIIAAVGITASCTTKRLFLLASQSCIRIGTKYCYASQSGLKKSYGIAPAVRFGRLALESKNGIHSVSRGTNLITRVLR